MAIFRFFKMAAADTLDFQILEILTISAQEGQAASPCQISSIGHM